MGFCESPENHPVTKKLLTRDSKRALEALKIINYAYAVWNITVIAAIDKDDPNNSGIWYPSSKTIQISPRRLLSAETAIYTLLHELGHAELEFYEKDVLDKKYPALHLNVDEKNLLKRPWIKKSQKYWIDYICLESDAWNTGLEIGELLKIKIDMKRWNLFKYKCMRPAGKWLAVYSVS